MLYSLRYYKRYIIRELRLRSWCVNHSTETFDKLYSIYISELMEVVIGFMFPPLLIPALVEEGGWTLKPIWTQWWMKLICWVQSLSFPLQLFHSWTEVTRKSFVEETYCHSFSFDFSLPSWQIRAKKYICQFVLMAPL
jgi:hypothetical protein